MERGDGAGVPPGEQEQQLRARRCAIAARRCRLPGACLGFALGPLANRNRDEWMIKNSADRRLLGNWRR
jgi:hypothetical protein